MHFFTYMKFICRKNKRPDQLNNNWIQIHGTPLKPASLGQAKPKSIKLMAVLTRASKGMTGSVTTYFMW